MCLAMCDHHPRVVYGRTGALPTASDFKVAHFLNKDRPSAPSIPRAVGTRGREGWRPSAPVMPGMRTRGPDRVGAWVLVKTFGPYA